MNTAIITAIIGAAGTVLAALAQLLRGQSSFRKESSAQHGVLLEMVERTAARSTDIFLDVQDLKKDLARHINDHDKVEFVDELPAAKKSVKRAK